MQHYQSFDGELISLKSRKKCRYLREYVLWRNSPNQGSYLNERYDVLENPVGELKFKSSLFFCRLIVSMATKYKERFGWHNQIVKPIVSI